MFYVEVAKVKWRLHFSKFDIRLQIQIMNDLVTGINS